MPEDALSNERLIRFALDDVGDDEREAVRARIAGSDAAAAFVDRVLRVIETMRGDDTEAPSAVAVERVVTAWAPSPPSRPVPVVEHLRRVVAQLVFDSRAQPALAGFRGADAGYQLAFDSEAAQVDVRVAPVDERRRDRWRVRGQVTLHGSGAITSVSLRESDSAGAPARTGVDEDGLFKLDADTGSYDLVVETEDTAVVAGLALG